MLHHIKKSGSPPALAHIRKLWCAGWILSCSTMRKRGRGLWIRPWRERRGQMKSYKKGKLKFWLAHTTWNDPFSLSDMSDFTSFTSGQEPAIALQTRKPHQRKVHLATSEIIHVWKFPPLRCSWVEAGVRGHGCLYNPWGTMQLSKLALHPFRNGTLLRLLSRASQWRSSVMPHWID